MAEIVVFQQGTNLSGTVTPYAGAQDTWIGGTRNGGLGTNVPADGSNGFARNSGGGDPIHTAVRFDNILGAAQGLIPDPVAPLAGGGTVVTTIDSATLTFTQHIDEQGSVQPYDLHRVLVPWTAATAAGAAGSDFVIPVGSTHGGPENRTGNDRLAAEHHHHGR